MKHLPRVATIATTTLTAVALTASMSACSSNSSNDAEEQNTDQQVTAEASTGADDNNDATAGSDDSAKTEPTVPSGYTSTEVPDASLSLPVPEGWEVITGADLTDTGRVEAIASVLGYTADQVKSMMENMAMYATDASGTSAFAENYNVQLVNSSSMPNEADFSQMFTNVQQQQGVSSFTPGTFSEPKTASGKDASMHTYSMNMENVPQTVEGAYLAVPTQDGRIALVTISTTSAERTQELANVILGSI